jgi:hypothetical protein
MVATLLLAVIALVIAVIGSAGTWVDPNIVDRRDIEPD